MSLIDIECTKIELYFEYSLPFPFLLFFGYLFKPPFQFIYKKTEICLIFVQACFFISVVLYSMNFYKKSIFLIFEYLVGKLLFN